MQAVTQLHIMLRLPTGKSYEFFKSKLHHNTDLPAFNSCGMYLQYDDEMDSYYIFTAEEYNRVKRQYNVYHNVAERMGLLSDFEPDEE